MMLSKNFWYFNAGTPFLARKYLILKNVLKLGFSITVTKNGRFRGRVFPAKRYVPGGSFLPSVCPCSERPVTVMHGLPCPALRDLDLASDELDAAL